MSAAPFSSTSLATFEKFLLASVMETIILISTVIVRSSLSMTVSYTNSRISSTYYYQNNPARRGTSVVPTRATPPPAMSCVIPNLMEIFMV
jgi:hypothetical protein